VWTPEQEKLLGRVTDRAMAARLGLKKRAGDHHRGRLGIAGLMAIRVLVFIGSQTNPPR
jgi:hypothetical protein